MALESEILRTANLLIKDFGEMAAMGAFIKADELNKVGDQKGRAVWLRVARAVNEILSERRPVDTTIH